MNKLFSVKGEKFKLSAQGRDLALFVGNGTKVKIPSEIKPPLGYDYFEKYKGTIDYVALTLVC